MPAQLRVVQETGVCSFCWRILPIEQLRLASSPGNVMCRDHEACVAAFCQGESVGWAGHPRLEAS